MLRPHNDVISNFQYSVGRQDNFFNGTFNTLSLDFDPLINGYSFFKWTKLPKWVEEQYPYFADLTEKNFKEGFSLSDIELETTGITHGFNANEYNIATGIKKNNTDFNIKHQEFSGSPIRNMYQYWISGIRDPETGIATYAKIAKTVYAAKNHTGEIVYIVTRPDANNVGQQNIEFACYFTAVMPTKIQISQFSHAIGTHSETEYDQSFKGCFHMSAQVDEYAKEILRTKVYGITEMNAFDPSDTGRQNGLQNITSEPSWAKFVGQDSSVAQGTTYGEPKGQ